MAHILIVDSVKDNINLLQYFLKQDGHQVTVTTQALEALGLACQLQPDTILLNTIAPDIAGLTMLEQIKKNPLLIKIPIIMLMEDDNTEQLSNYFDLGAHDYIAKPFKSPVLRARIKVAVAFKQYQDRLAQSNAKLAAANQRLEHVTITDTLTQLVSRDQFYKLATIEVSKAKRFNNSLAIIIVDADKLKHLNNNYGHTMGDEALRTIAEICRTSARDIDIVGRLGSAEIAICCAQTGLTGGKGLAERIRSALENTIISDNNQTATLSVSSGVSELKDEDDIDTLVNRATQQLYQAKALGRNRVCADDEGLATL